MSDAHADTATKTKFSSGPKKAIAKRKPATKRAQGYRPRRRNDLYALAGEFRRRHPKATGAEAWAHFAGLAGMSAVVLSYSAPLDAIEYAPDGERWGTRRIKRESFERRYRTLPGGWNKHPESRAMRGTLP